MAFKFYRDNNHGREYNRILDMFENEMNQDAEVVQHAKELNEQFFNKVKEIVDNPKNAENCGELIIKLLRTSPRIGCMYLRHEGKRYEIEVDYLAHKLDVLDIDSIDITE